MKKHVRIQYSIAIRRISTIRQRVENFYTSFK